MVSIDVFSRFAFAQAIKSKKGQDVIEAFKAMMGESSPMYFQTDKEFINKQFQDHLMKRGITFSTLENSNIKCSLAERFDSTLQGKMWRYFTHYETYTYIDVLQDLVHSYNYTFHRALGGHPEHINSSDTDRLFYHLYKLEEEAPIKKGQKTRMLIIKKTFNRGYEPNWTEEIFTVKRPDYIRGYGLEDTMKEAINVQKVKFVPRKRYTIEKILKYLGTGDSDKFNTWGLVKNIRNWI